MTEERTGDYFITDVDDDLDDDLLSAPVVVPEAVRASTPLRAAPPAQPASSVVVQEVANATPAPEETASESPGTERAPARFTSPAPTTSSSREERLASALDSLMAANPDIQAAALVSLDGFSMASALPEGMQEDRVGAMSAAILGLGERAAAELGRGKLGQVYIEGDDGFVVLISAGGRAVLTALANANARLGLVLYDMRSSADEIGSILG